jgi:uncharacterized membrane protein
MYTLIMLMIACAAVIGFCVMFAFFMREWNDRGSSTMRDAQNRIGMKIVKGLYRQGSSTVIEYNRTGKAAAYTSVSPPKFQRYYGFSEKISEVSEK